MFTGLNKVSIFDPSTGTVVQCNDCSTDGEFSIDAIYQENIRMVNIYTDTTYKFSFTCYNMELYNTLYDYMIARTPMQLVTAGNNNIILWYESVPIIVTSKESFKVGNRKSFTVSVSIKGNNLSIYNVESLSEYLGIISI